MLKTDLAGTILSNPLVAASGCFGFGTEYKDVFSPHELGAITLKAITLNPCEGNKGIRVIEVRGGLLNSIGLENPGLDFFLKYTTKNLERNLKVPIIANIAGDSIDDYVKLTEAMSEVASIQIIEINASCPNVSAGGMSFGSDQDVLKKLVAQTKRATKKPLFIKLTPNVTDITPFAKICEDEGADGITLINTLLGMRIDVVKKKPFMQRKYAGLSGGCIMPVALRCVYQARAAIKLPIIGMGGIETTSDALEFLMAGANAIGLGSIFFKDPLAPIKIKDGLLTYMRENKISDLQQIIGKAHEE
jgi:dihydroorotate dehydrogenase (NAD+) catalytic subunit